MNRAQSGVRRQDPSRDEITSQEPPTLKAPDANRSSIQGWVVALSLAGLVVCAVVLLAVAGSGALVDRLRPSPTQITTRTLNILRPGAVRSERVLDWLAGTSDSLVIDTALEYNEAPTAYALTLFAGELDTHKKVRTLHATADQLRQTSPGDAASLYAITGQAALVSPAFDDVARAQLLLQTGDALLELRHRELAVQDWQQVSILARYGPTVPTQMRVQLLEQVAARYDDAGETARAVAAREHARTVLQSGGYRVVPAGIPAIEPADWPDDVLPFVEQRRDQARMARAALDGGRDVDWRSLEDALLAEEGAVQNWLATSVDEPLRRQERYRRWIQQRRLLAVGVLEAGAIPRIEARRAAFDQIMSNLWEQREPEIQAQLQELPEQEAVAASRAWLEYRLFVNMLGGDPQADVLTLRHELEQLNGKVPDDARLRLVHQPDEQMETRYWRLPIGYFRGTLDATDVFR